MEKLETTIPSESLKDGKIVLDSFPQAVSKGVKIEGRIKYQGFDSWSPWISSQSQVGSDLNIKYPLTKYQQSKI